ncbi:hypothetical protein H0H92_002165 [Tricholoma furcatifolium]|nr:hypothetical protein H0H92_002165 [Tricholoma furcatifolium]
MKTFSLLMASFLAAVLTYPVTAQMAGTAIKPQEVPGIAIGQVIMVTPNALEVYCRCGDTDVSRLKRPHMAVVLGRNNQEQLLVATITSHPDTVAYYFESARVDKVLPSMTETLHNPDSYLTLHKCAVTDVTKSKHMAANRKNVKVFVKRNEVDALIPLIDSSMAKRAAAQALDAAHVTRRSESLMQGRRVPYGRRRLRRAVRRSTDWNTRSGR